MVSQSGFQGSKAMYHVSSRFISISIRKLGSKELTGCLFFFNTLESYVEKCQKESRGCRKVGPSEVAAMYGNAKKLRSQCLKVGPSSAF